MDAFWIILAGSLVAIPCGLLGCYLILRKMAMIGDAISHAVLPGIVIAFFVSGSREPVSMLLGAGILGILTTFLIEFFHTKARLQTDAAIGVTFTWLFALGVILISVFAGQVDLDQDCVLYGEIAYVPIDLWITDSGRIMGPRVIYIMGMVFLVVLCFILIGYKELFLTTFDPAFASATGISVALWHYLLMGAVSFTTVGAFESVGAILVVAFLIVPPATAYLLTEDFKKMMLITALLGLVISFCGYYLAVWLDGSIAGAMSVVAGLIFGVVFLLHVVGSRLPAAGRA
ncbi:MAG: manganese transport system membrane protein MntD [Cyclobacteriaceae bacterium]|nr:MAG: manganese transport system membrane protein MntD [Cyclobacteriaceae bacterium]